MIDRLADMECERYTDNDEIAIHMAIYGQIDWLPFRKREAKRKIIALHVSRGSGDSNLEKVLLRARNPT